MKEPNRTRRLRKGRLLMVGKPPGHEELEQSLNQPCLHAANLFEAIGELASAAVPVATVLINADCLPSNAAGAIEALRRTDPSLRVLLSVVSNASGDAIVEAGKICDQVLNESILPDELRRIIEAETEDASWEISSYSGKDSLERRAVKLPVEKPGDRPQAEAQLIETLKTAPARPLERDDADFPLVEPPRNHQTETLGDTDLVQAAMSDPEGLLDTALRLIIQKTGWKDLRLEASDSTPAGVTTVDVTCGQTVFGRLATELAPRKTLEPWADWLAIWLMLDRRFRDYRRMAFQDDLTGAWNRRYFFSFLRDTIRKASRIRRPVTVMVFDIDNFKKYNDEFGHAAGDEILIETVRLLHSDIRPCDRVCRIGGDEFAVIFADLDGPREAGSSHPETVEKIARRFQTQICEMNFPKLGIDAPGTLSISGGLATYPWDGSDPETLLRHADQLSLQSKRKGKNALTFGPGTQQMHSDPGIDRDSE